MVHKHPDWYVSWKISHFQVISLEGWTDVMYFVQDAHSFWNWLYFVLLIVVSELEISEGKRAKLCEHKFLFCHI